MEWTKEELELMGLAEDAKPEDIKSAVALAFSELKPLKDAQKAAEKQKSFSEMYPEEAAELAEARERRVEDNAKKFSEQYESIKDADGKPTGKGFSGLVLSKIVDTHKAFSEGKVKDGMLLFSETLDVMAKDTAIVDYAERGSNRTVDEPVVPTQHKEAVRAFAEAINKVQNDALAEGKTMSYGDALAKAATENPELAKAYSERQTPTA